MEVRKRIIVKGIVQGVGFRYFVKRHADRLRLRGYVKNLPDGESVEIVAIGPEEAVEKLIELARRGPPAAVVDSVTVEDYEGDYPYGDFRIVYES